MDSGRTEHHRESEHIAPHGRREEQQVEICRQNSKENIAERQNLAVSDGAESDEDVSNTVRGSNFPVYITIMQARDPHSVATLWWSYPLPEERVFQG